MPVALACARLVKIQHSTHAGNHVLVAEHMHAMHNSMKRRACNRHTHEPHSQLCKYITKSLLHLRSPNKVLLQVQIRGAIKASASQVAPSWRPHRTALS